MFFKNHLIFLFLNFLWCGLLVGLFGAVCALAKKLFRRNVYVCNLLSFCFWLLFGGLFAWLCYNFYNYSFCWFGLLAMVLGVILIKISIEFFFTILAKLLYNKIARSPAKEIFDGKSNDSNHGISRRV